MIYSPILALLWTAGVTFNHDIAPIVYRNCAPCHRPGESAPFPLLTYGDVKRHATQIADVTKRRFMPPWLPDGSPDFVEHRGLTGDQIEAIQKWVEQGAPLGSAADARPAPQFPGGWQLGK